MTRHGCITALFLVVVSCSPAICGDFGSQVQFPVSWPAGIVENSIEMTCTDKPVQLGYSGPVQFRATCPGIWAVIHQRVDESSFRRRFFTYSHYAFKGSWDLKDQGMLESIYTPTRELFLVLPGDLIEFRSAEPDCFARVNITNMGYMKKASLPELQQWIAHNRYMEQMGPSQR